MAQQVFKSPFDLSQKLSNPTDYNMSAHPYHDYIEYVDTDFVDKFKEYDREQDYLNPKKHYLDELTNHIEQYGFEEPLIMGFNPKTGFTRLIEGNHRLAAAKRLGIDKVPVRMLRRENIEADTSGKHGGYFIDINKTPHKDVFIKQNPDWKDIWGYMKYKEDLKPSDWFYEKEKITPYKNQKNANIEEYLKYLKSDNAWEQWRFR